MKPERKTEVHYYWACSVASHRHRTEEIAARCIGKVKASEHRAASAKPFRHTAEGKLRILSCYRYGMSISSIARGAGVSGSTVREILEEARRLEQSSSGADKWCERHRAGLVVFKNPRRVLGRLGRRG